MRSKAPLALMEQMIMVLVFALAAALCLRAFAAADALSREKEARDRAITEGQSMAEIYKSAAGDAPLAAARYGGRAGTEGWVCLFDGAWALTGDPGEAVYRLEVVPQAGEPGLGTAQVSGTRVKDGLSLFSFPVAWQEEVDAHE